MEPNTPETTGLVVAHTVASVNEGVTVAFILNTTGKTVELKRGLHLCEFDTVREADIAQLPHPLTVATRPGSTNPLPFLLEQSPITIQQEATLSTLLQTFESVFSLSDRNNGKCTH